MQTSVWQAAPAHDLPASVGARQHDRLDGSELRARRLSLHVFIPAIIVPMLDWPRYSPHAHESGRPMEPRSQTPADLAAALGKALLRGLAIGAAIYLVWVVGHMLVLTILG
jgi:hypothetical protein